MLFPPSCCRSSDSDGAFETPESTTPVKTASPIEPQSPQLLPDENGMTNIFFYLFFVTTVVLGIAIVIQWNNAKIRGNSDSVVKEKSSCTI